MDPIETLALVLDTIKASGAAESCVELEGLKVSVKFTIEGPEKLDSTMQDAPARTPVKPAFKVS